MKLYLDRSNKADKCRNGDSFVIVWNTTVFLLVSHRLSTEVHTYQSFYITPFRIVVAWGIKALVMNTLKLTAKGNKTRDSGPAVFLSLFLLSYSNSGPCCDTVFVVVVAVIVFVVVIVVVVVPFKWLRVIRGSDRDPEGDGGVTVGWGQASKQAGQGRVPARNVTSRRYRATRSGPVHPGVVIFATPAYIPPKTPVAPRLQHKKSISKRA